MKTMKNVPCPAKKPKLTGAFASPHDGRVTPVRVFGTLKQVFSFISEHTGIPANQMIAAHYESNGLPRYDWSIKRNGKQVIIKTEHGPRIAFASLEDDGVRLYLTLPGVDPHLI